MVQQLTLGALQRDGVMAFGDGYRTKQSEFGVAGFRVIRAADVREGEVLFTSEDLIRPEFERQIGAKAVREGDVVLTTKGTVGRVALVRELIGKAAYSPQLCWFRVADFTVLDPSYLLAWLRSSEFKLQASHMQANSDMAPYISLSDLRSTRISLPALEVQRSIGHVLLAFDNKMAANARENRKLAEFRDSLLPELMSGRIRVSDIQEGVTNMTSDISRGPYA
ncbi:restriction endonuclease subunit S [Leifsonia sp. NPDC058248]|uniref:restriction endonuclease subunit S n=1 Tax=Leifsonia sp. NPDC058248 TaxID=3346402 RepID=UPI0036DEB91D